MPTLIVSLPKAFAPRAIRTWLAAIAPPATSSELLRRKSRREVPGVAAAGLRMMGLQERRQESEGMAYLAEYLRYRATPPVAIKRRHLLREKQPFLRGLAVGRAPGREAAPRTS